MAKHATMLRLTAATLLLLAAPLAAQQTRTLGGEPSPPAAIADLAWLAGSWTGTAMGGRTTETYSAPLGGRITGHFVLEDGKGEVAFTEIVDYVPVGASIAYRVRHFNADMTGWEDKTGKPVMFPLVAVERDRWYFDGMTIERTGPDALTMWVRIEQGGKPSEVPFRFTRAATPAR